MSIVGSLVQNEHGARFQVTGTGWTDTPAGLVPVVELDHTVSVSFGSFVAHFSLDEDTERPSTVATGASTRVALAKEEERLNRCLTPQERRALIERAPLVAD